MLALVHGGVRTCKWTGSATIKPPALQHLSQMLPESVAITPPVDPYLHGCHHRRRSFSIDNAWPPGLRPSKVCQRGPPPLGGWRHAAVHVEKTSGRRPNAGAAGHVQHPAEEDSSCATSASGPGLMQRGGRRSPAFRRGERSATIVAHRGRTRTGSPAGGA